MLTSLLIVPLLLLGTALGDAGGRSILRVQCRAWLSELQGHDGEIELAGLCRSRFRGNACRTTRQVLGPQPWTPDRIAAACDTWASERMASEGSELAPFREAMDHDVSMDQSVQQKKASSYPQTWWNAQMPLHSGNPGDLQANPCVIAQVVQPRDSSKAQADAPLKQQNGSGQILASVAPVQSQGSLQVIGFLELTVVNAPSLRDDEKARRALVRAIASLGGIGVDQVSLQSVVLNWEKFLEQDGRPFIPGLAFVDVTFAVDVASTAEAAAVACALTIIQKDSSDNNPSWDTAITNELNRASLSSLYDIIVEIAVVQGITSWQPTGVSSTLRNRVAPSPSTMTTTNRTATSRTLTSTTMSGLGNTSVSKDGVASNVAEVSAISYDDADTILVEGKWLDTGADASWSSLSSDAVSVETRSFVVLAGLAMAGLLVCVVALLETAWLRHNMGVIWPSGYSPEEDNLLVQ